MSKGKTTSKRISEAFTRLRKYSCWVGNFNNKRANNPGLKDHPDWLIIKPYYAIIWVETKIGRDTFSEGQEKLMKMLCWFMGMPKSRVYYYVVTTAEEAEKLSDRILVNKL